MPEQNKTLSLIALIIFAFTCVVFIVAYAAAQNKTSLTEQERYKLAADYSRKYRGLSVLIIKGDKTVFEEYQNDFAADDSQMLASGTKSFAGVMLAAAIEDKLIKDFDEKVSETLPEWKSDKQKEKITLRQLLSLTAGLDTGDNGKPPTYKDAVNFPAKYEAGTMFEYGPVPFQVFGEVMRRKLLSKKETPLDYLKRRILEPIGLKIASWTHQDGQPNIPSGAFLTAREWAKFGLFLKNGGKWNSKQIVSKKLLEELVAGTKTNPNYGLTFWLNRSNDGSAKVAEKTNGRMQRMQDLLGIEAETTVISKEGVGADLPKDLFMAAGAGKQRLYIIPSMDLVIVRQGNFGRFDDREFLKRLILGQQ